MSRNTISVDEYKAMVGGQQAPWSNARKAWACPGCALIWPLKGGPCPTCKFELIKFHSGKEARVFCELVGGEAESKYGADRIFLQVTFPLLALSPDAKTGRALKITVDFVLVAGTRIVAIIDPKGRKSREWERGKRALEATLGVRVTEV